MKFASTAVILALPWTLGGCQAMMWGQLTAVLTSALIFAGTLALGRSAPARSEKPADGSVAGAELD